MGARPTRASRGAKAGEAESPPGLAAVPALNEVAWRGGLPVPSPPRLDLEGPELLLEIPADWDAVCAAGAGLAQEWQQAVRRAFESAFARGYAAAGFVSTREQTPRAAYVLRKDEPLLGAWGGAGSPE